MSTPLVPPHIEEFTAPKVFGNMCNWTLYGVLVVQTYVYIHDFPRDRALLKLLGIVRRRLFTGRALPPNDSSFTVYTLFLVETLQTALSGADLYYWFVSGFGNTNLLSSPYMAAFAIPIIGSIISLTVQLFSMYRIWVLSERSSRFICLIICLCSAVAASAAFAAGVYIHVLNKLACNMLNVLTFTWLSGNVLSDVLITGSILLYLGRRRKEGGHFSDHALSRIIRLAVGTNVLTATVWIVSLLMALVFPDKTWFTCPLIFIGKLYSNTLLSSLNNRISIREALGAPVRPPVVSFAPTPVSQHTPEIVYAEPEKPLAALLARSSVIDIA
ncbi:hypothetical protein H4582DRAFT_2079435 [Lactarius indigo]|nr:hypothetical protein H4582DRAFT_2079435 [Lactarius indigo]